MRLLAGSEKDLTDKFQSTHPRGVRRRTLSALTSIPNFNPRTHVGCDGSIARRAIRCSNFNPRTHVGCDSKDRLNLYRYYDFNPRTHVGCDPEIKSTVSSHNISIHAPTWGATYPKSLQQSPCLFQSTHPRGVRLCIMMQHLLSTIFQSTHPRGVRHMVRRILYRLRLFQSTHPRGVRRRTDTNPVSRNKFQSTHPRGVRQSGLWNG